MLTVTAAAHFFVDAVCAAALFGSGAADMAVLLLLYNTIAFSTQCLVGLALDAVGHQRVFAAAACALVALGLVVPLPPMWMAGAVALGNSVFHVAAGTLVLRSSGGRAAPLGVFVGPGAVGLVIGTLYPNLGRYMPLFLGVCAGGLLYKGRVRTTATSSTAQAGPERGGLLALMLLLAVAARAVGGSAVSFPWKTTELLSIIAAVCVCTGKAAGGFVCDRIGANKTALLSIPAAALLTAFFSSSMLLSLMGQFLLNLTMPVTLYLIYRSLPDSPGFAFGLAASVLWPGAVAGQLMAVATGAPWLWVVGSMTLGLAAILLSTGRLDKLTMEKGANK